MINVIPSEKRHFTDMGWLQTYWLFSFSNYYDPTNINHGALRVFNDDIVLPGKGFGIHPHEEMEIISVVLEGEMEHQDTMGNTTVIKKNDVQRMTAGTGLQHSEWNHADSPVHFFQIWVLPQVKGLTPSYDQKNFHHESWRNQLTLLAGGQAPSGAVSLNTDALVYRTELDAGQSVTYETGENRKLFSYIIEGHARADGIKLKSRDQARIHAQKTVELRGDTKTEILLIDVPTSTS